jgi:hypothetical protein
MDTKDFHELLQRYERQSYRAGRLEDVERQLGFKEDQLARAKGDIARLRADLKSAEAKVAEWEHHGEHLFKHLTKRMQQLMPKKPKPLETEIPF